MKESFNKRFFSPGEVFLTSPGINTKAKTTFDSNDQKSKKQNRNSLSLEAIKCLLDRKVLSNS
jgi:hypothetical protein